MNPQRVNNVLTEAAQGSTPAVTVAEAWLLFSEEQVQVLGLAEHQPPPPEELVRVQGKTGSWLPLPRELDLCRSHLRTWTLRKKRPNS